jgi:hypothetical protein
LHRLKAVLYIARIVSLTKEDSATRPTRLFNPFNPVPAALAGTVVFRIFIPSKHDNKKENSN